MKCVPEGLAGLPPPSRSPVIRRRRDPEGSRLSLRAVAAPPESRRWKPERQLSSDGVDRGRMRQTLSSSTSP